MGSLGLTTTKTTGNDFLAADANLKVENFSFVLPVDAVGAGEVIGTKQAAWKAPWACEIVSVRVWCRARTGASDPTVDVYEAAGTILTAPVTLAADATFYDGAIADGQIAALAEVTVRCTTAGAGSISDLNVELTVATP